MRLVLQRVSHASVRIDGGDSQPCGAGLVLLIGICPEDTEKVCDFMAEKAVNLRIFDDENGNMNRSLLDVGGECLAVSNFTLYANSRKGRRPSFVQAAGAAVAEPLYEYFVQALRRAGVHAVHTGRFGADMQVELCNDGPVTILLDSAEIMPQ